MTARNHYETLGVSRDASADEIKRAYRKLARTYHPDRNQGDSAAEERFKEVGKAFEVLSDDTKRRLYDELGDDAERIGWDPQKAETYRQWARQGQTPGQGGKGGLGVDLDDLFGAGFGGGASAKPRAQRGQDVTTRMQIGFEESIRGATRELRLRKPAACGTCAGEGRRREGAGPCTHCKGSGQVQLAQSNLQFAVPCPACGGSGRGAAPTCEACGGRGAQDKDVRLDVKIPPGIKDGQKIRLGGQGAPGRGGAPSGDLLIEVAVAAHPHFRRRDQDLEIEVPVTVPEALLGAEIEVPTLDGPVRLKVPAGSQSDAKLRLRGKGVPGRGKKAGGDLFVILKVRLPSAEGDDAARARAAEALEALYSGPVRDW